MLSNLPPKTLRRTIYRYLFALYSLTNPPSKNNYSGISPVWASLISGGFCGLISSPIYSLVELSSIVMQVQKYPQMDLKSRCGDNLQFEGSFGALYEIYSRNGFQYGIFNGYFVTCIRLITGCGIYFSTYEYFKMSQDTESSEGVAKTLKVLTAGGMSGFFTWLTIYPLDCLKTMMQSTVDNVGATRVTSRQILKQIIQNKQIGELFRGYRVCLIRSFPTNALSYLFYESTRNVIGKIEHELY